MIGYPIKIRDTSSLCLDDVLGILPIVKISQVNRGSPQVNPETKNSDQQ
ncbi:20274_t:CDS:2 [Cetraspora pellucida]|uniref:20274_t:CDS:1 n=1 Tax=Cetraspora pellucida TaxID=1433469 RepID=A0A9N8WPQ5_9GLOM|nr:20274_t:CDS:2 [Cetraspora pellucida]